MHKHMKTNVSHVFKQHGMEHVMCHRLWKTISKLSKTTIECTMFTERVMIWERAWATHWTSKSNITAWCVQICGESNAKMGKKTNTGMFFPRVGSQNQSEIPFLSHIFSPHLASPNLLTTLQLNTLSLAETSETSRCLKRETVGRDLKHPFLEPQSKSMAWFHQK